MSTSRTPHWIVRRALALALAVLPALPALAAAASDETGKPGVPGVLPPGTGLPPTSQPVILPTIEVSEVQTGQRGYGISVFAGSEPERFEVEVIGVMRNTMGPDTDYILARLTGKGLEKSGVIAGMSGSPVFLDGRLAGAVSFGWPFSNEAIAGITPIADMRKLSGLPGLDAQLPMPPPPVKLADLAAGRLPADLLTTPLPAPLPAMMSPLGQGAIPGIQWFAAGFGERSLGMLQKALGGVVPAGRMSAGGGGTGLVKGPSGLFPGSPVAAVLVDGDLRLASSGTVTDRMGDEVFAFGHPFLGFGPVSVPMANAEVVTVLSSQYSSFKISNIGDIVGAFEQDRRAGIQGRIGAVAPMVPMELRVLGPRPRTFRMRVADVPQFLPMLAGSAVLAGLEATSYTAGAQGIDLTARLRIAGHGDLEVRQSFDGDNAVVESAAHLLAVAGYLAQNPLERVHIESIDVEVEQVPLPRTATLVGAHADRTVVRPGDRVTLNLDLVPYRGERVRRTLAVDLPHDLPNGRYSLLVGDGRSADAARLAVEPADPVTLEQALELLRSLGSRRDLVVLGVFSGQGLAVAGEVMPRLPASVRSLWAAAASGSSAPLRLAVAQQIRTPAGMPVEGLVRVDLEVRRREAVTAGEGNGEAAPAGTSDGEAAPAPPSGTDGGGTGNVNAQGGVR